VVAAELTIGELAARTGVRAATLRMWETRYAFPEPNRSAGRQRRYPETAAERVRQVVAARDAGLSLPAAIDRVRGHDIGAGRPSLFALLRGRRPDLSVQRLPKRALAALSHAIEDEACARAEPAVLVGCFQREEHYRQAERRWSEFARTAAAVLVFADFPRPAGGGGRPIEVPLERDDPVRREWVIAAYGPAYAACLIGWEPPGQHPSTDAGRSFETVWTVEREPVRLLVGAACSLAVRVDPGLRGVQATVDHMPASGGSDRDLTTAIAIANRMISYLSRVAEHR
jgi:DICT domain-containing protein